MPLSSIEALEPVLNTVWPVFRAELPRQILRRLGLKPRDTERDSAFLSALFSFLNESKAPYEQFFFDWRGGGLSAERAARSQAAEFYTRESFRAVANELEGFEPAQDVNLGHPYFRRERPRTMLIEEMEAVWAPIAERDDWSAFRGVLEEIGEMREAYGVSP